MAENKEGKKLTLALDFGGGFEKPPEQGYSPTVGLWNPFTQEIVEVPNNGFAPCFPDPAPKK